MDYEKLLIGTKVSAHTQPMDVENEDFDFPGEKVVDQIALPISVLKKHVSILGASGSGKTVLGKVLIEEASIQGIPSIIIDPQGDLASLAILGKKGTVEAEGTSAVSYANYRNRSEVRIFTPASTKGIPLSINPLKRPPPGLPNEDFIRALDLVCISLVRILGYKTGTGEGKAARNFLFEFLKSTWQLGFTIKDFSQFSEMVLEPESIGIENPSRIITDRERKKLSKNLKYLSMGMDQLLFNFGVPVDMGAFLKPVEMGKVPVNVVYLNTLTSEEHKQFFVAMIAREIYTYMLQHPSNEVQLLFLIDEIAPYLPPHPRKPPAKDMLKLLFKQGRKYGVSCIMCTQNPADVDYKAMAQANTWALGRMMAKQDLDKVKHILRGGPLTRYSALLSKLPSLKPGEFVLIAPDALSSPEEIKVRYLITEHLTLEEDRLSDYISKPMKEYFEGFMVESMEVMKKESSGTRPQDAGGSNIFALGKNLNIEEIPSDSILFAEIQYPQNEATREARKKLEGSMIIFKREVIEDVKLRLIPIWRVGFNMDDYAGWLKIPLIRKKGVQYHYVYFHGSKGKLLYKEDTVKFTNMHTKNPGKLDFLQEEEISVKKRSELPVEVPRFYFYEKKVLTKMETMFGIKQDRVDRVQKLAFPVWEFTIKEKELKQRRKLYIDAVFGKEIIID